ncbi:MAG: hypothetical protein MJZ19_08505 [Paludibacteraceae bacterium]|nr:hypothetical protein [Paludibacteraceae bacterium]
MAKKFDLKPVLVNTAGATVGAVASNFATKLPFNSKVSEGIAILAGCALQALMPKNELVKAVGVGLAAGAASKLAAEFVPAIAGFDDAVGGFDDAVGAVIYDDAETGAEYTTQNTGVAGVYDDLDD